MFYGVLFVYFHLSILLSITRKKKKEKKKFELEHFDKLTRETTTPRN